MSLAFPRHHSRRLFTAALATATIVLSPQISYADGETDKIRAITDKYLFELTLNDFVATRAEKPYPNQLDWRSDACTLSPDKPLGYRFTNSCDRHDFGYRNYRKQDRFSEPNRERIDNKFKSDMYSTCDNNKACETTANVYYWAVRQFGATSASTADAIDKARITKHTVGHIVEFLATTPDGRTVTFRA